MENFKKTKTPVEALNAVGNDFMTSVFTAEGGQTVVAPNDPTNVFYVVDRVSLLPEISTLRASFSQPTERQLPMFMTDGSARKIEEGFFEATDEATGFRRIALEEE